VVNRSAYEEGQADHGKTDHVQGHRRSRLD